MTKSRMIVGLILVAALVGTFFLTVVFKDRVPGENAFLKTLGLFTGGWLTLCIFTFLYKDNPFYRLAEHVMVGLAMGYVTVFYTFQVLEQQWFNRLFLNQLQSTDVLFGSAQAFRFALVIPAFFGILMWLRIFPSVSWLSRWSMALVIGLGSGIALPWTIQGSITKQVLSGTEIPADYMLALRLGPDAAASIPNLPLWQVGVPLLIIGTICGLIYFFFSVPHRGIIGKAATLGIWILMLGFGASFGLTVMARLSLFIGRILFLLKNWAGLPWLTG